MADLESLADALERSLAALPAVAAQDEALRALAMRYAASIDEAAVIAAEAAEIVPDDEGTTKALRALQRRVEAAVVLAEIGPKLHTALDSLGMTPKARSAVGKPPGAPPGGSEGSRAVKPEDELARVRNSRSPARQHSS